ncbi:MAG: hypothetical protein CTY29_12090 [Methylobacter sp.]|nr:MAG: hypothetical protein CTY29_12090 [Methylobacter sp.]
MNTLWHKVWADLWLARHRSLLAIINIAIGVASVGALFGMVDMQLWKMDFAHRNSQPSHINLMLRSDMPAGLQAKVAALPEVAGVDTMTPLSVRYRRVGDMDWMTATLIIRPDYRAQQFDITRLLAGQWPGDGQVAVENLTAEFTGLAPGQWLEFETGDFYGTLPVAGIVRHPFIKPPKFGGQAHFFAEPGTAALFGIKPKSFRQLLVQIKPPYSAERARAVAGAVRSLLAGHGGIVNVTLLQDPDQHWGRPFMAGLNEVLQVMALVSLALASVLMLNTMSAHMAQQTAQIGVMKALGAGTLLMVKLYLGEVLILALAACALALPLGLMSAQFSTCRILALFNIDCGGFDFSPRAVIYMLAGGLIVPLLAALAPILRASGMTVRVALDSYGMGGDSGGSRFERWLENVLTEHLSALNAVALGNLVRRKTRLVLTQGVLIIAGVMFLVLMSLIASVNLTLDNEMARSRFAVRLGFSADQPAAKILETVQAAPQTQKAEFWLRKPVEINKDGVPLQQKGSLGLQMLALPEDGRLYRPLIEAGRWLEPADAGQAVLVVSADTAALNDLTVGDSVDVKLGKELKPWRIIGTYRWLAGNNFSIEPVYAPLHSVKGKAKDMASLALLQADIEDKVSESNYLQQLNQDFQAQNIQLDAYTTQAKLEQRQFARNQFNPVINSLLGLAAMIAAVGGIGLSGTLAISVLQRTREIGVLRATGAPAHTIFRLFLAEGLLHGVLAWLLSVPLAYLLAQPLADRLGQTMLSMKLDYCFDVKAVFYWLGSVLLLALLASLAPARKAAQMTVRESLAQA